MDLIPDQLLREHEDGRVVFFCGAGVSVPAGLPSFKKLVQLTLEDLLPPKGHSQPRPIETLAWQAFKDEKYDEALGILESPQHGEFEARRVREKVIEFLSKPRTKTLEKHLTLAQLAGLDMARGRLVTTNFDMLFERAQKKLKKQSRSTHRMRLHIAPGLPPAKPETFQGLAYLHGKLGNSVDDRQLVLTTADFGSAYMLEGWALRFVIDLFRHYHVVFIGYSLNDPTMRYLVQALAVARNEHSYQFREPYAFASYSSENGTENDQSSVELQWKFKGITPIPYAAADKHEQLWKNLKIWAGYCRQGTLGRRMTVSRLGRSPPASDQDDSIVKEMIWALNDADVVQYFAEEINKDHIHPGWIQALQKHGLLSLPGFHIDSNQLVDVDIPLVTSDRLADRFELNDITRCLGSWIANHLDSQEALDWALLQGARLHRNFRREIRQRLDSDRTNIPPTLRTIWRLLSDHSYANMLSEKSDYPSDTAFVPHEGLRSDDKLALWQFLNRLRPIPILNIKLDHLWGTPDTDPDPPQHWCEIDIGLVGFDSKFEMAPLHGIELPSPKNEDWEDALIAIVDDITIRLREAMDWFSEFGMASASSDHTCSEYPSISLHERNNNSSVWTYLIVLARESHDILVERKEHATVKRLVKQWRSIPYPVFRRLTLYAVTENPELDIKIGLELLLDGTEPALWDIQSKRETLRFIRKRAQCLSGAQLRRLVEVVLLGPPRENYKKDLSEDKWNTVRDNQIFLRLHKLKESSNSIFDKLDKDISATAEETYERLQRSRQWKPSGDHSEEFCLDDSQLTGHDSSDRGLIENFSDMSDEQFLVWLETQKESHQPPWECGGGWYKFVTNNTRIAVERLKSAADQDIWIARTWYPVLDAYRLNRSDSGNLNQEIAGLLVKMPKTSLSDLSLAAARWFETLRKQLTKKLRRELWRKIWKSSCEGDDPTEKPDYDMTLNHAGGIMGNILYMELKEYHSKESVVQNTGFPKQLIREFKCIADDDALSAKLARARLSSVLFELFRIDPEWTERSFFDRMDCSDKDKFEPYLWEGFFMHAQRPAHLLQAIKPIFIRILQNLDLIPRRARSGAVQLFTFSAMPPIEGISTTEANEVLWELSPENLATVATVLGHLLLFAYDNSESLWNETIHPWFRNAWPTRKQDRSPALSQCLIEMAIKSGDAFPSVVEVIKDMLTTEHSDLLLEKLETKINGANVVRDFPEASLILIDKICRNGSGPYRPYILRRLLNTVRESDPSLCESELYKRLLNKTLD